MVHQRDDYRYTLLLLISLCKKHFLVILNCIKGIFKLISRYLIDLESYHWAYKISPGFGKFMQGGVPPFLTLGDSNHYHKFDKYCK